MIGTNRDLAATRELIDSELLRLRTLKRFGGRAVDDAGIDWEIASLQRERAALCVGIANRRNEAARKVVVFSRWTSGDGALDNVCIVRRLGHPASGRGGPVSRGLA